MKLDTEKIEREAMTFLNGTSDPLTTRLATDLLNVISLLDAMNTPWYIANVFEGDIFIGCYSFQAEFAEDAQKFAEHAFGSEHDLSYRWGERGRMYGCRIEVREVHESRFAPGTLTDWPDAWKELERD